jgi:hypothetical protein
MATSPTRARTRKATPKRSIHAAASKELQPTGPLQLTSTPAEESPRVIIAYLDDYELTMPEQLSPGVGLKLMRTARTGGGEMAMTQMLEEVLGDEAYQRLIDFEGLTGQNLADLFSVVQRVAMGKLEVPKASSKSA